jgi:hypothetical protein
VTAAGDVDGDGRDDILLTAVSATAGNAVDLAGEAVLVLASPTSEVNVADGEETP